MLMVVLKNEQFQRVRLDHWISFHDFVSPFSTIFSSSSARLEQLIKIRSPTNLKRHVGTLIVLGLPPTSTGVESV